MTGRLLEGVPAAVLVRGADDDVPAARLLAAEFGRDASGQDVVLDRSADLVLVTLLRAWAARAGDAAPPWWRAEQDAVTGAVLPLA